jgi:hypothetical protein
MTSSVSYFLLLLCTIVLIVNAQLDALSNPRKQANSQTTSEKALHLARQQRLLAEIERNRKSDKVYIFNIYDTNQFVFKL